jgi:glycosyltransferase involved in cell wall biosynthesis
LKIVFIIESFFPHRCGGTEVYVLNLCHYFKKNNWEVNVLITTSSDQKDYLHDGISIHTFSIPLKPNARELNGLQPPRGIDNFVKKLQSIQPQVVHFHSLGRAINGYHLKQAKDLGYKTIFTPHLGNLFCIKGNMRLYEQHNCDGRVDTKRCMTCLLHKKGHHPILSRFAGSGIGTLSEINFLKKQLPPAWQQAKHRKEELCRIEKYADLIFSIAPWIQQAFKQNGIMKSVLIPQGISPVFFVNHNTTKQTSNITSLNFIFVGRMHPFKGFHLLVDAWDQLKDNHDHKLHIITSPSGDENEYFNTYKNWAINNKSVTWNENLSQSEVANYLNKIDVLVLPSISNEVAPLVILEAATRNIPVITSDYIAMKDMVIHEKNGLIFENGDSKSLHHSLRRLEIDEKLLSRLKQNIPVSYSMDDVGTIIKQHIEQILIA